MLECSATNDVDSPNNITFMWLKDDKQLNSNMVTQTDLLRSRLFIQQLDPKDHSGNYSCGVYNNKMSDSVFTNTTVTIESELVVLLHRYIYLQNIIIIAVSETFKDSPVKNHETNSVDESHFTSNAELPTLDNSYAAIGYTSICYVQIFIFHTPQALVCCCYNR